MNNKKQYHFHLQCKIVHNTWVQYRIKSNTTVVGFDPYTEIKYK